VFAELVVLPSDPLPAAGAMLAAGREGVRLQSVGLSRFSSLVDRIYKVASDWDDLRGTVWLQHLSAEAFDSLCERLSERRKEYPAGSVIIEQGDTENKDVYLLLEGEAAVSIQHARGDRSECGRLRPGDFFGERAGLRGEPRSARVEAGEGCVCAVLSLGEGRASLPPVLMQQLQELESFYLFGDTDWGLPQLDYVGDLGAGCYGNVVLMRHRTSGEPVALKVMRRAAVVKARQCSHVMSEKRLLLELRHPFIVRLHATFKDSERLMMAMQYVAGGELYSLLMERGRFDEAEARYLMGSVALMLEHVHLTYLACQGPLCAKHVQR